MIATQQRAQAQDLSQAAAVEATIGPVVGAGVLVVVVCLATVRFVAANERLVAIRAGRVVAVRGPGLAAVIPGWHRCVRVSLKPARVDLLWVDAVTADRVPVTVNGSALVTVRDPAAYALALDAMDDTETETVAVTEIRRHITESGLAALSDDTEEDRGRLAARVSARTAAWGVEFGGLEFSRVQVRLPADLIRWAQDLTGNGPPTARRNGRQPVARPETETLHHCMTRSGQHVGVVVDDAGHRKLVVYGSADLDVPAQTILLERGEADRVADLLHSHPVGRASRGRRLAESNGADG